MEEDEFWGGASVTDHMGVSVHQEDSINDNPNSKDVFKTGKATR